MISKFQVAFQKFQSLKMMVVGDLYLDEYVWGKMAAISDEGPIPVIHIRDRVFVPGAAGNTACGIRELGAATTLVGSVGDDINGKILLERIRQKDVCTEGVLVCSSLITNARTRIVAESPHIAAFLRLNGYLDSSEKR